ncbi:MAG: outer membrane lipoprotein-sorting protein [Wenzhouxiangella sp.]|nr:outer membrane lipoprotein-sorting protein [Wenzhouxiangella sp.]
MSRGRAHSLKAALACLLALYAGPSLADDGEQPERGRALMAAVFEQATGVQLAAFQRMELIEPGRESRVRELYVFRRGPGAGSAATLIRFTAPGDIAGTGLLSIGDSLSGIDQWLYLPAHGRVRRIPAGRQGGRFAGSDFSYEDLRDRPVDLDQHRWLGEDWLDGERLERVESRPIEAASSSYAKRVLWIDAQRALPLRIDFYRGRDSEPFKRFQVLATERVGHLLLISDSLMLDLASGHQTRLRQLCLEQRDELPDYLFSVRALEDPGLDRPFRPCT